MSYGPGFLRLVFVLSAHGRLLGWLRVLLQLRPTCRGLISHPDATPGSFRTTHVSSPYELFVLALLLFFPFYVFRQCSTFVLVFLTSLLFVLRVVPRNIRPRADLSDIVFVTHQLCCAADSRSSHQAKAGARPACDVIRIIVKTV